jgi:hypothetical protein
MIFDNSEVKHELIAEKTIDSEIEILNSNKFGQLKKYFHENA